MQNSERMKLLEEMMLDQPDDPFPPYALALEWAAIPGQEAVSIRLLVGLRQKQPEYLPLYYQLGHLLARSGDIQEARSVLLAGRELAVEQKNMHARAELEAYIENLDEV